MFVCLYYSVVVVVVVTADNIVVVVFILGIAILYDILIAECSQCESAKSCQQQFSIGGLTFIFYFWLQLVNGKSKELKRLQKQ